MAGIDEYLKSIGVVSYKHYCTCGGYSRKGDHPHLMYCSQYEEYEQYFSEYENSINQRKHDGY